MSTATLERTTQTPARASRGVAVAMANAEFLKVRKRRGLVVWGALLTIGAIVLVFAILAILHAQDPIKNGPAGGAENLGNAMNLLATLGAIVAVLIGAAVGAGDLQAGVFRDLVATGRSRTSLFAARVPGGLALLWPLMVVAWIAACVASVVFAAGLPHPTIGMMLAGGGWVLLATGVTYALAVGIASLTGSRSMTIGILLAWMLAISQLLAQITALGSARQALLIPALNRLAPHSIAPFVRGDGVAAAMSVPLAIVVVAAWAAIPLALGAWRTRTRDA